MVGYNKYLKSRYSFSVYMFKRNYLGPVLLATLFLPVPFRLFSDSFFSLLRCIRSYYACTLYRVWCTERQRERERIVSHQLPLRFSLSIVDIAFIHFHSVLVLKRSREREERKRRRKKRADVEEVRGNEAKSELKKADRPQPLS